MDIKRKLELTSQAIKSISQHTDEESLVRLAALDEVVRQVNTERDAIRAEIEQAKRAALGS